MRKEIFNASDEAHIKKEREQARLLKNTKWWKSKLQKGICYHCRQAFSQKELTMDHLIPLAKGGKTGKNNIVTSCKSCNFKKSHKTLVEIRLEKL